MKLFITSTGTNIGKTLVTTSIAHKLSQKNIDFKALKPVISGWNEDQNDVYEILKCQNMAINEANINSVTLYKFKTPLSPNIAAKLENKSIEFNKLVEFCSYIGSALTLIEGAGGIMSPISDNHTNLDLIKSTNSSVILVVGNYLGSISHTLTAFEVIKYNNIPIDKIVISDSEESDVEINSTLYSIKKFTNIPIITIPRIKETKNRWLYVPDIINYDNF